MRTTVTLDDDVAVLLEKRRKASGKGFKEALNEALREALSYPAPNRRPRPRRRFKTFSVGKILLPNLDDISEVLEIAEGPGHK